MYRTEPDPSIISGSWFWSFKKSKKYCSCNLIPVPTAYVYRKMEYYNILTDFSSRNVFPYDSYDYLRLVIPAPYPLLHTGTIPPLSLVDAGPPSCYATRQNLKYNIMYLSRETPAYGTLWLWLCRTRSLQILFTSFFSSCLDFLCPASPGFRWLRPPPSWLPSMDRPADCYPRLLLNNMDTGTWIFFSTPTPYRNYVRYG